MDAAIGEAIEIVKSVTNQEESEMYIRYSRESDKESIERLFTACFGDSRHYPDAFENLQGRYLLAFTSDNTLIAMSGLYWSEDYQAYEIDWSCTAPKNRGDGVMHELFKRLCSLTDEPIYCSCWRLEHHEHPNLYGIMKDFGFKEVINRRVTWVNGHNCHCNKLECVSKNLEGTCECYEDLYLREGRHGA